MTNSNENTLFAQKEQAPKHLTFSAGVKRLRSHWFSLKGRSTRKEYWLIGLCIYIFVGLALNIASIILFFILPGITVKPSVPDNKYGPQWEETKY